MALTALAAVATVCCSHAAHAQDAADSLVLQPTPGLSSGSLATRASVDRVKLALLAMAQAHPEVQAAEAVATSGGFELEAARMARYPRLKVGSAAGSTSGSTGGTAGGGQAYTVFSADVRMALVDGGGIDARIRAAEAQVGSQSETVRSAVQKVALDALTAYLQVQRYDLKVRLAGRSADVLGELARIEQRRVDLGATGENDLRMAGARRSGIRARQQEFNAQRADARSKFESYFRFLPNTDYLPPLAAPGRWLAVSRSSALEAAEAQSPEIAEAQGRVARAEAQVQLQEASRWPTVEAVVGKTKDPRGVLVTPPTRAGLELNWNFGTGFDAQLRIRAALAEVDNQQARLESARRNLQELTAASWERTIAGRERESELRSAVAESEAAFLGRRRLLEFGRETLPHVLDAQVDYYTLLLDYVDAVFDLRITELRLARATGRMAIARDSDNGWIDEIFTASMPPLFEGDRLQGGPCGNGGAGCSGDIVADAGEGVVLRWAQWHER